MRALMLLAVTAACAGPSPADDHRWLVGAWTTTGQDGLTTTERWMALPSGDLLGTSTLGSDRVFVWAESLAIVDGPGGRALVAWPAGQPAVTFPLVESGPDTVAFENPDHDFPRRLVYTRAGQDTLDVRATGTREGAPHEERWTLQVAVGTR